MTDANEQLNVTIDKQMDWKQETKFISKKQQSLIFRINYIIRKLHLFGNIIFGIGTITNQL